jgi:hypothetical protein
MADEGGHGMSAKLREAMTGLAASSPTVQVPAGLFDVARRRRRVRVAGALMTVTVMAGLVSLGVVVVRAEPASRPAVVRSDRHPPSMVGRAPRWVADLRDAPLERAQLAYVEPDPQGKDARLIVLSGDRYRQAALGGTLSPDGRYLAYQERQSTKLVDVSTGAVAMVGEGEPVAWSRRGEFVVLRRSLGGEDQTEMNVVSVPSGAIAWRFDVVPPCAGHHVALSPDNFAVAVGCEQFGTYLYRRAIGLVWHIQGRDVAGPQAWAPDGRTIATWAWYDVTYYSELFMLDVTDGASIGTIPVPADPGGAVVAWHDGLPVVQGNDWVFRLSGDPSYVTRVQGANRLWVATDTIDFASSRPQGGIDAGPALARYRGLLSQAYLMIFLLAVIASVLIARRIRRRRLAAKAWVKAWARPRSPVE